MNRSILFTSVAVCLGLASGLASAGDLMPAHIASELGLVESWRRYVQVPAGSQSIVDQKLYVHSEEPREYVEIIDAKATAAEGDTSNVLVRIPTDRLGADGLEIGKTEAERLARNEIRRLKRRGVDAKMSSRVVPNVRLYSLGTDGTLECRDAESGEPVWMARMGDRHLGYRGIGVNEEFVSVINGANLLKVDATNGEVIQEVRTIGTPMFGAIHSGEYSLIPIIRNGVEGYPLYDTTRDPFLEIVSGLALSLPTKSPDSSRVAWGTDRGFVYVMELQGTPSVLFRLNTDGIVSGRVAAASGDRFFFGSEAGQVYGIRATRVGKVLWSQPYGEPFYNEPMVVGDQLLIRSTYGSLYSLNTENGISTWDQSTPNVDELIGAFGNQVFIRTLSGSLAVVDLKTGNRIGTYNEVQPGKLLVNNLSNRLFLVGQNGAVQCLRPEGAVLPTFTKQPDLESKADSKKDKKPENAKPKTPFDTPAAGKDPFGAGADPFGAGGNDPFGGGAAMDDPFGGGAGAAMDDPFGGADPFGN